MTGKVIVPIFSILMLSACLVGPRRGGGLEVVPILPVVVEIGDDDYYSQGGYHYFYTGDRWYYSSSRDGDRRELPRSHWPREVHRRGGGWR
ncbi:hypothetical protein [Geothrix edaphica]|uniref:YXWGXW repeat-containing protein n=1 Tax=Geothrix edaphica TaxID=2927976 RepID=A0ABQ5PXV8_9BACT|nr:hypothetical protein [Geothrix edaphica]GLH67009.1 hypothetical protein GETHED_13730 [Geothrix edaphica]